MWQVQATRQTQLGLCRLSSSPTSNDLEGRDSIGYLIRLPSYYAAWRWVIFMFGVLKKNIIRQNTEWRSGLVWWPAYDGVVVVVVVIRPSQSERLEYLENALTYNHEILQEHTYRSTLQLYLIWLHELLAVEMTPPTASGGISREWFKRGSGNLAYTLIGDNWPHKRAGYDVTNCFKSADAISAMQCN